MGYSRHTLLLKDPLECVSYCWEYHWSAPQPNGIATSLYSWPSHCIPSSCLSTGCTCSMRYASWISSLLAEFLGPAVCDIAHSDVFEWGILLADPVITALSIWKRKIDYQAPLIGVNLFGDYAYVADLDVGDTPRGERSLPLATSLPRYFCPHVGGWMAC